VADSCNHGDGPSDSTQGGEFPDHVSDYQLPKEDSAPRKVGYNEDGFHGLQATKNEERNPQ
jgi:hypothetical protein